MVVVVVVVVVVVIACHAFVDSFHHQLNAAFQERKKNKAHHKVLEIASDQMLWEVCDGMLKYSPELYGPNVMEMCREFAKANRQIIAQTFEPKFEVSDNGMTRRITSASHGMTRHGMIRHGMT